MRPTLVICALLLLTTLAVGQTANPAGSVAPIVIATPYGGLLIQSGYATTVGSSYPPLLVTPTANLSTVSANPVGATNATSNLQVGATNSTLESLTTAPPAIQTGMEVSQPPQAGEFAGTGLGAAQFDVVNARGPGDRRSLAEVARTMRQQPKPVRVRTFTNADVQSLKNKEKATPQKPQ